MSKRRKYRCIFKAKRGWKIDYYSADGKRHRELAGPTKEDADRRLDEVKGSIRKGTYVNPYDAPRFTQFCDTFHERHGQHKKSYAEPGRVARLKQFFGNRKLSAITADHIEQYRLARLAEPDARDGESKISPVTVNREIAILRAMLGRAVKWGLIATNPAAAVEDYAGAPRRERFLSRAEIHALLRATKQSRSPLLRPATYLALETGMRRGELLALRWDDIHFDASKILVRDSKNGEPRHVPMSRRARWLLRRLTPKDPLTASGWVFESRNRQGERSRATDTKTAWRRALRLAKLDDFRFHDLRHTFASWFAMKGGNLFALANILGHKNAKMTLDRYTHLSPEFIDSQRRVMDAPSSQCPSSVRTEQKRVDRTSPRGIRPPAGS